ncbi:tRNA dihydrouridine synthase [Nitratifractor sp.]
MIPDFSRPLYALAPLAGYTDLPFRSVVKRFGVDLTVSEMISANALAHNNLKTLKMLEKSPLETPYSVQIAGSDPETIKRALEVINAREGIDGVDLNCGCPAPKVFNNLQGSALLADPEAMGRAIETIRAYSEKDYVSVKMRLGVREKNHVELARICEEAGADFIAVHGRTRAGRYKAPVDYDAIAEVVRAVSIPVIANGDIDSPQKARWVLEHTGAAGVMIGRAAVGNPWIFAMIKEGLSEVPVSLMREVILEHLDQMVAHHGRYGAILFRKHLHRYSKRGFTGAAAFRDAINRIEDPEAMRREIEAFFSPDRLREPVACEGIDQPAVCRLEGVV